MSDPKGNEPLAGAQYLQLRRNDVIGGCVEAALRAQQSGRRVLVILNGTSVYADPGDTWEKLFDQWKWRKFNDKWTRKTPATPISGPVTKPFEERIRAIWKQDQLKSASIEVRKETNGSRRIILFDSD